MKIFCSYIKYHIRHIAMFLLCSLVFALVFYLYSLPVKAVLYAALLCFIAAVPFTLRGFLRFSKKHKRLLLARQNSSVKLSLPESENLIETDYAAIAESLFKEKRTLQSQRDMDISDIYDYYTLWAHQIKIPLAALKLILQSKNDTDEETEMQLFHIEQYVEMALEYMRCASNVSDYVIRAYELDDIVKQAVRKYAKSFIRKKITLNYIPLKKQVITDEKWLLFVIEQILSNSIKYKKSGGSISIYASDVKTLVIEDSGIGIAPEDIPRLFENGYTGYNGRDDKKATGIGLYLSRKILEKLSHNVYIESSEGVGTKVFIEFEEYKASE